MTPERAQRALADAVRELEAAEPKLTRAFARWSRARRRVRRLERELDKAFDEAAAQSDTPPFNDVLPATPAKE